MRRKEREVMDINDIMRILQACEVCRLGLNDDGYPYIVPVNYGAELVDGEVRIYFHGAKTGKKVELIKADSRVGFEMDGQHKLVLNDLACGCTMRYASVVGAGHIDQVVGGDKLHALDVLMQHYHPGKYTFEEKQVDATAVYMLRVERMTGKVNAE